MQILVPQGAEYQAVCRGAKQAKNPLQVVPIPVGVEPVSRFLHAWQQTPAYLEARQSGVLVMGLCGSLTTQRAIGNLVFYDECVDFSGTAWKCDRTLIQQLQQILGSQGSGVKALTSDRVIWSASEKQSLGSTHQAEVVDMEGAAVMAVLAAANIPVAMLRVVSDDVQADLPDLTLAIDSEGKLRSLPLALGMIRQPIAAIRLIQGSLKGLKVLQQTAALLASSEF